MTIDLQIKSNPLRSKEDVQLAVMQICDPLKSFYSEGRAHISIGSTGAAYSDAVAQMEGFSRVLWGLAPLLAGGEAYDLWDLQLEGIKNGTNPDHHEYWGNLQDYDQRIVEMAAFGLTLAIAPEKIWEPLNEIEKANLVAWLDQVNHYPVHDCNWLFFPVLVNLGFKEVGVPYNEETLERNLNRIDDFYLSDGWYADGIGGHADYYVSFALHFYGLFYAKLMENEDPERANRFKDRATLFAHDFIYWFAEDGSALPYGRSMTYRFSQSAFWSALAFAEVEAFPYGVIKGLVLNNLRWWFQQPIFSSDGLLTIGYRYPNLVMGENYNSPSSPYWALKTFLILVLKDDHPFWQAEELPFPTLEERSVQQHPHLVLCRQESKNHLAAFNTGHLSTDEHTHTSAKYEKFVYSNVFGFSVPRGEWGLQQGAFDSMLALSEGDNLYRVKRRCEKTFIENDVIYSRWKPWGNVDVETWLIPGLPWHIRIHCIRTERYLDTAEGGFALPVEGASFNKEKIVKTENDKEAVATFTWGTSAIRNLNGSGKPELVFPNANTNLIHSKTVIPMIKSKLSPGTHWLVSAVYGEPESDDKWNEAPRVEITNDRVVVYSVDEKSVIFEKELS